MSYSISTKMFPDSDIDIRKAKDLRSNEKLLAVCLPLDSNEDWHKELEELENFSSIDGVLPMKNIIKDKEKSQCQIFYESGDFKPLDKLDKINNLWVLRRVAKILQNLQECNLQGNFIGKEAIFVDENNWEVRVGFIGLRDVFYKQGWIGNQHQDEDEDDEIYCLAKCFEDKKEKYEILEKCLGDKDRRPDYEELLKAINTEEFHPEYTDKQTVGFNNKSVLEDIIEQLNTNDCYVTEWKYFKQNGKNNNERKGVDCDFYVGKYQGKFVRDDGDEHFFIPHVGIGKYKPRGKILKKKYVRYDRKHDVDKNLLNEYEKEKREKIKQWSVVPKKEKEFIEKNAFEAQYKHVGEKNKKLYFVLGESKENLLKEKIITLKDKKKQAEAPSMAVTNHGAQSQIEVGFFDDIKDYIVIVKESKESKDTPSNFDFFIKQGEKKLFYIPDDNEPLDGGERAQCVVTRGSGVGLAGVAQEGRIGENISLEVIPFKRQIEAVSELDDVPNLKEFLVEPESQSPRFGKIEEPQKWYSEDKNITLNEKQKEAVKNALHSKLMYLIQGPPGTGKTTIIEEIIRQFLESEKRAKVLICSQTHVAVDNVLKRLPKNNGKIIKIRLGDDKGKIDKDLYSFLYMDNGILEHWAKKVKKNVKEKTIIEQWEGFLKKYSSKKNINDKTIRAYGEEPWESLRNMFFRTINVIGSTCSHIASYKYSEEFGDCYDLLIIDEASKAIPAETLIPMVKAKKIVLVGDHRQLPPYVNSEKALWSEIEEAVESDKDIEDLKKEYTKSLFETLIEDLPASYQTMLNEQRRMPKQIGDIISKYFYKGELKTPTDKAFVESKKIDISLKNQSALFVISTSKNKERYDNDNKKERKNDCNKKIIIDTLKCLNKKLKKQTDIAIIAAYKTQVENLVRSIKIEKFNKLEININTVDSFQGNESDIVIYDIVRSARTRESIGFLDEPRRLNVALSRAKKLLLIVGDVDFVRTAKPSKQFNPNGEAKKPILGEILDDIAGQEGLIVYNPEDIFT